jgi:hypothetical protein
MVDRLPPPPPPASEEPLQYTHSGGRYLLGVGERYFGIWDRAGGPGPVERFPRTTEGWQAAWRRYVALEPSHAEVGLSTVAVSAPQPSMLLARPPDRAASGARAAGGGQPTHPAWWLLPILMGWMGGLLAWLLIRDHDPARARAMLVTGIVATVGWLLVYSLLVPVPSR